MVPCQRAERRVETRRESSRTTRPLAWTRRRAPVADLRPLDLTAAFTAMRLAPFGADGDDRDGDADLLDEEVDVVARRWRAGRPRIGPRSGRRTSRAGSRRPAGTARGRRDGRASSVTRRPARPRRRRRPGARRWPLSTSSSISGDLGRAADPRRVADGDGVEPAAAARAAGDGAVLACRRGGCARRSSLSCSVGNGPPPTRVVYALTTPIQRSMCRVGTPEPAAIPAALLLELVT